MVVDARLEAHRAEWARKPALRLLYQEYHRRLLSACSEGPVLEIGGGSGHLKQSAPDVISIDILGSPWIDAVADAHRLPFAALSFGGIVMIDVLHHLRRPLDFMREAARVLRPSGRLAFVEPGITPLSYAFYKLFHEESTDMRADPFRNGSCEDARDPFEGNQALPTLLFAVQEHVDRLASKLPDLRLVHKEWDSLFAYPLSGGFRPWCLLPAAAVHPMLRIERTLSPILGWLAAFRLFIVMEKV